MVGAGLLDQDATAGRLMTGTLHIGAMVSSVTRGRALRSAKGSARGLLNHYRGHCRTTWRFRRLRP